MHVMNQVTAIMFSFDKNCISDLFLDMPRAEWAVDSVLVGVNDTSEFGFEDDFEG